MNEMKTILVIDNDQKLHGLVIDGLKAFGSVTTREIKDLIVKTATGAKEAASILGRFKVDLIVTDIDSPDAHGFQLLTYMKQGGHIDIPVIAVTPASSPEVITKLEQIGVAHFLTKPFVLLELLEKILDVLNQRSKALISDFAVPNFLQALKMEGKTCSLKITSGEQVGYLHLENGDLIDAETDALTGDRAAIEILGWENTELKVEELSSNNKRIETTVMQLLMQAAHAKEREVGAASTADAAFNEITTLIQGRHHKQALKKLAAYMKANPRNHEGWLWYSRITDKITSIEKALGNAKKIAPDDPEVAEEIEKIAIAKKVLQGEAFSRCPYCWAPLNVEAPGCPYCRAHLFVDEESLNPAEGANEEILKGAIDRYTRVVGRETNADASYYLAIAHLNLQQWEKGLDQLNKTVDTYPDNEFFTDQLEMLMGLLASREEIFDQETGEKEIGADLAATTTDESEAKKILVVESSPTIRKVISIALSKRGYKILEAEDGLRALNCLDKARPDMILMDVVLPKLDAQKTLSVIRDSSTFKDVPVIILTGKKGLLGGGKKKLAGATAYLPKPLDLAELLKTTEKHV